MNTVEIDLKGFKIPIDEHTGDIFREVRNEELPKLAQELQRVVLSSFATSGIRNRTGKVLSWQQAHVAKGYVAVRPQDRPTGKDGPGAITNYLEVGHKGRQPTGKEHYRTRVKTGRARAFAPYRKSQPQGERLASALGETLAAKIAERLEHEA